MVIKMSVAKNIFIYAKFVNYGHRFERITRYNLGLASIGNSLETVRSYANNS
jgi:hypothetical protein